MTASHLRGTHSRTSASVGARLRRRWQSTAIWIELTRNLAVRDVQTRYKHSMLGLYWALINPLLNAAIFTFVFQVIFKVKSGHIPYLVFFISGLTFWNFFAASLNSAALSITGSAALLAKLYFPRVVLPTGAVVARLIDLAFSAVIVVVFTALFRVQVHWTIIFLPPVLAIQVVFTLGLSYVVAALNVLYRDISQLLGLVLLIWIYLSPIMYPASNLPNSLQGILLANPMGALIQSERDLIYAGHLTQTPYLWLATVWAAFAFIFGLSLFKRIEPLFSEVM